MRTKVIQPHAKGCYGVQHQNFLCINRRSDPWRYRDVSGGMRGNGHLWLQCQCIDPTCGATVLVSMDDVLDAAVAALQNEAVALALPKEARDDRD